MSNNWALQAAENLKQRMEAKNRAEAKVVHEQNLRDTDGPLLWGDVRRIAKELCTDLNREYGKTIANFEIVAATEMRITTEVPDTGHREFSATFRPGDTLGAMEWVTHRSDSNNVQSGEYQLGVVDGKAAFITATGAHETAQAIAEKMLDSLICP